jgi:transcriptional regulator with XRE-family HTH domain
MLGDVLRRNRLEQGRTLSDVARAARVSMPYLSELERGRKEASSEILAAVCDALRIELSDLSQRWDATSHGRTERPSVVELKRPPAVLRRGGRRRPAWPLDHPR